MTGPLHPLTFALRADAGTRARLGADVQRALGEPASPMPASMIGETPLVMSARLHAEVDARTRLLADWVAAQHASGRWRDDPRWPRVGAPDCLCIDLAIVHDESHPEGWGVRWVEFQAFLSLSATVHALHEAARREWPALADLRPWDRSPRFGDDWLAASRHWMAPAGDGILLEHAPHAQGTAFDLQGSAHLWNLRLVDTADLRLLGEQLQSRDGTGWAPVSHVVNRYIVHEQPEATALHRALAQARVTWRNHPAWFDRVHKGLLPELPLAAHERCARADHWRTLGLPAQALVLKASNSWGGAQVRLDVDAAQLDALPDAARWIVQPRYRALPLLQARDGAPLLAELRVMLALEGGAAPWVAARMARVSRGPVAGARFWRGLPGEGACPLYPPPDASSTVL